MSFVKRYNKKDVWNLYVSENKELLSDTGLPQFVIQSEKNFRWLLQKGEIINEITKKYFSISKLSMRQLLCINEFITHKFPFDMDTILFEAFNEELQSRRERKISVNDKKS